MAHIVVIPPNKVDKRVFQLEEKYTTVGRTPANGIQIDDGAASRKHLLIKAVRDAYTLVDLGSANGTVVNGSRVKEVDLTDGDRIKIGKTVLVFKES